MTFRVLTPETVAERIGMSTRYVRGLCESGELPARKVGKFWRIEEVDFDKWWSPYKDDNDNWCADYVDEHGKRRRPSLTKQGVRTEAQAKIVEARLIARVDGIKKGIVVGERNPDGLTVRAAMTWYLELPKTKKSGNFKSLKYVLEKHIAGDFASMRIELVKSGDIAAWLDEREAADELAARTVNRLRAYLSGMFSRLIARDLLVGDNPVGRVERRDEEDPAPRLLPAEAIPVLLDNASSKSWAMIFHVAAFAGMRRSEIQRLTWGDVDFARGTIIVRKAKAKKARIVPIHAELRVVLEEMKKDGGAVITRAAWGQSGEVTRDALKRGGFIVPADVEACFHSIRHTFITHAVDCGADPWAVEWITHGPPSSLRTMGKTYLKPIASLARELAKLSWPRPAKVLALPVPAAAESVAENGQSASPPKSEGSAS